jgi:hypothetical protein
MSMTEQPGPTGADELIDDLDLVILRDVRALTLKEDPVPAALADQVSFALDLLGLEDEVAQLETASGEPVGVRGIEESRTITFDSESLTIVVQVSPSGDTVRVDGWLAPPSVRPVRMRTKGRDFLTESDPLGRFVLLEIPHGLVQIVVGVSDAGLGDGDAGGRHAGQGDVQDEGERENGRTVVTPAMVL